MDPVLPENRFPPILRVSGENTWPHEQVRLEAATYVRKRRFKTAENGRAAYLDSSFTYIFRTYKPRVNESRHSHSVPGVRAF